MASSLAGGHNSTLQHQQQQQQLQQRRGSPLSDQFALGGAGSATPSCLAETPHVPGVISILDVTRVEEEKFGVTPDASSIDGLVAHFLAHANEPIASVAWNQSGQLLFTADRLGHDFHIFKVGWICIFDLF